MKNSVYFAGRPLIFASIIFSVCLMTISCSKYDNSYSPNDPGNPGTTVNPNEVIMQGTAFSPASLSVKAGTKVTWRNNDYMAHTVTSDTGLFDSGSIGTSGSYSYTFTATGTYSYHCNFHSGMTGVIVVN